MVRRNVRLAVLLWVILAFALAVPTSLQARTLSQDEPPVVYGILFYSPTCPHCHQFIENDWPPMHEEFGDQFELIFVDVSTPGGSSLMTLAVDVFEVPEPRRGVPMMIIGTEVMVGGHEIPTLAPDIVRAGLEAGGIGLPPIPGLQEAYDAAVALEAESEDAPAPGGESESIPSDEPVIEDVASTVEQSGMSSRSAGLLNANGLAVAVLLGLTASMLTIGTAGVRGLADEEATNANWLFSRPGRLGAVVTALVGLGTAITLVLQPATTALAAPVALGVVGMLLVVVIGLGAVAWGERRGDLTTAAWALPLTALAGMAVAYYMAHVEVTGSDAFCGVIGDCNTVQQSPYARLFGIVPIGVLGLVGYAAILLAWVVTHLKNSRVSALANVALLALTLGGTLFSIYLTFLEPFVIGATCAWCLTSAIIMLLLLWLAAPGGWRALGAVLSRQASV